MLNIIIPTYKAKDSLPALLDSLVAQTKKLFMVTIVQDCDGEDYSDIIKEYERRGLQIFLSSTKTNGGPGVARQRGIDITPKFCEHIMFVDSDDILLPQAVELLTHEMNVRNADLVSSLFIVERKDKMLAVSTLDCPVTWCHGKIYRTSYLKDNNIRFPEDLRMNEDAYFNLVAFNLTKNKYKLPIQTYLWRNNKESLTRKNKTEVEVFKDNEDFIYAQLLGLLVLLEKAPEPNYGVITSTLLHIYNTAKKSGEDNVIKDREKAIIRKLRGKIPNFWKEPMAIEIIRKSAETFLNIDNNGIGFYNENFQQWFNRLFGGNKMKVFIVNGMPCSGKTTFEDICIKKLGEDGYKYSSIDFVKEAAAFCGWNGTKTPKDRAFLSDFKDLLTKWNDVPMKKIQEKINTIEDQYSDIGRNADKAILFVDIREPWEIEKAKKMFDAKTLLVRRDDVEHNLQSNHADAGVFDYEYDIEILNNGNLEDLEKTADDFLKSLE